VSAIESKCAASGPPAPATDVAFASSAIVYVRVLQVFVRKRGSPGPIARTCPLNHVAASAGGVYQTRVWSERTWPDVSGAAANTIISWPT